MFYSAAPTGLGILFGPTPDSASSAAADSAHPGLFSHRAYGAHALVTAGIFANVIYFLITRFVMLSEPPCFWAGESKHPYSTHAFTVP